MTEKLPFLLDSRLSLGTMHNLVSVERSVLLGTCLIKESAPSTYLPGGVSLIHSTFLSILVLDFLLVISEDKLLPQEMRLSKFVARLIVACQKSIP